MNLMRWQDQIYPVVPYFKFHLISGLGMTGPELQLGQQTFSGMFSNSLPIIIYTIVFFKKVCVSNVIN